jgi:Tfp pilus assembly protein PilN
MINLLPPDVKSSTSYARRNSLLRKWCIGMVFSILAIAAVVGVGQIYLQQSINDYTVQVQQGQEQLKAQKIDETQAKVQELTDNLKLVVQVLSKEVLFSKLVSQIGAALPNGTILTSLSISKVQGGLDLGVSATDYQAATQAQLNLQDPKNKLFDKADINNIECNQPKGNSSDDTASKYPCSVAIRALFTAKNPFLFITPTGGSTTSSGVKL